MLLPGEIKAELARILPARACCRRAELAGLLHGHAGGDLRTLDHATARTAVQLATVLGVPVVPPPPPGRHAGGERHHLCVRIDPSSLANWRWADARDCDRRAWLRGVLLASGSVSLGSSGPHIEFVFRSRRRAEELWRRLRAAEVISGRSERRERHVVYIKGREQIAGLCRVAGANRALLDWESDRVAREVRNRLTRLLNAEEANLGRTVRAADRQLRAIERLERDGALARLPTPLREAAGERRRQPEADLDSLASSLGITRSAMNHRLRRLVQLAVAATGTVSVERSAPARTRRTGERRREAACAGR